MLTCSSSNSPCRLLMICCWNCEWSCCILVRRCFSAESCSHCSLCWMAPCFCCSAKSSSSSYAQHGSLTNDWCCIAGQHHVLQPCMNRAFPCISLKQCMLPGKLWAHSTDHLPRVDAAWLSCAVCYSLANIEHSHAPARSDTCLQASRGQRAAQLARPGSTSGCCWKNQTCQSS